VTWPSPAAREPLREVEPNDEAFTELFDRFEYLLAIAYADLEEGERLWAPVGSFGWRQRRRGEDAVRSQVEAEAREEGDAWPFLQGPLFGGGMAHFPEVKKAVDELVARSGMW
jgi:hypothetical protein